MFSICLLRVSLDRRIREIVLLSSGCASGGSAYTKTTQRAVLFFAPRILAASYKNIGASKFVIFGRVLPATRILTSVRTRSGHRLAVRRNGSHRSGAHYPHVRQSSLPDSLHKNKTRQKASVFVEVEGNEPSCKEGLSTRSTVCSLL